MFTSRRCRYIPLLLLPVLPAVVFAQDGSGEHAAEVSEVFSSFLEILSWLRVVPAVVAGKLMTNDFVYGEFINLTTILWQLWQAMRVFAYLVLGFVFIGMILRFFIKQEEPSKLGDALKKTFIAGILIQMSWFLLALLIDLSLVLTAAVSAVPLQVMQDQRNSVETKFEVPVVHIDADTGKMIIEQVSQEQSTYLSLDDVTPDANTVGGSLVFLAAGVMRLTDARFIGDSNTGNAGKNKEYSGIIIAGGIKLLIVIMFVVPMVVLMIINAVRIFWIWIWIILSPFIILDVIFNGPLQKSEDGDKFKLSTIFGLIFQPVVVVGLLSLGMILIVGVLQALLGGEDYKRGSLESIQVYVQDGNTTKIGGDIVPESYISGEMFKDLGGHVGGFVGEMVLALFSIFLLWSLVKAGASFSAVTNDLATKGFKFAEGALKAVPVPGIGSIAAGHAAVKDLKGTSRIMEANQSKQADAMLGGFYEKLGINKDNVNGIKDVGVLKAAENAMDGPGTSEGKTKAYRNTLHKHIASGESISRKGEAKTSINKWFNNAGREYLGLSDEVTIESSAQARNFVTNMMTKGFTGSKNTSGDGTAFTDQTTRGKDGKTSL